ncbi:helix-turn-helix domain-containing protein [Nodosilinea sp. AN01ver1]|uniref:helix-turn-helix domain-containing protein n=1 Tax=Nodosilinea sp. AN01ver1 TaxID=3423362 RepID=UPI003D31ECD9
MKVKSNLPVLMAKHEPPLNQAEVARRSKVSPTTINQLYNDALQRMDKSLCERLYGAFGWTPGDIWVVEVDNFDHAVEAYADYCDRIGAVFQQPSRVDSEEKRGVVYLRNVDGLLARYSVKRGDILGGEGHE